MITTVIAFLFSYRCNSSFTLKKNLYRHERTAHELVNVPNEKNENINNDFDCYVCDKKFCSISVLNRHKRTVHQIEVEGSMKCPLCTSSFLMAKDLDNHLDKVHEVKQETVSLYFSSLEGKT
jgi:uncharacterized C2H2 Zn-finger protein